LSRLSSQGSHFFKGSENSGRQSGITGGVSLTAPTKTCGSIYNFSPADACRKIHWHSWMEHRKLGIVCYLKNPPLLLWGSNQLWWSADFLINERNRLSIVSHSIIIQQYRWMILVLFFLSSVYNLAWNNAKSYSCFAIAVVTQLSVRR